MSMNFLPNCVARSRDLKQIRGLRYARAFAVMLNVPAYTNPAASWSYLIQGDHLARFGNWQFEASTKIHHSHSSQFCLVVNLLFLSHS